VSKVAKKLSLDSNFWTRQSATANKTIQLTYGTHMLTQTHLRVGIGAKIEKHLDTIDVSPVGSVVQCRPAVLVRWKYTVYMSGSMRIAWLYKCQHCDCVLSLEVQDLHMNTYA
jgi:hypothetical protein